jgi:hypothetical protein
MKGILTSLTVAIFTIASYAQGYEEYQKVNGLEISTKWGTAKNAAGERKDALMLKVENDSEKSLSLSFDVNLYYEGILRETGRIEGECIPALKSRIGKLNGIYFIPEKFTSEQLKTTSFSFSLDEIEVDEVEDCE